MEDYLYTKVQGGDINIRSIVLHERTEVKPKSAWKLLNSELHQSIFINLFLNRKADEISIVDQEVLNLTHFTSVKKLSISFRNRGRYTKFIQDIALSRTEGLPKHVTELTLSLQ